MENLLDALGQLIVKALPTTFLVILLHLFLKRTFYGPLEGVLEEREKATAGARSAAQAAMEKADEIAARYEAALRDARSEIFREQEAARARMRAQQKAALDEARRRADQMVREAKAEIEQEKRTAKSELEAESDALAEEIVEALLERRAS